MTADTDCRAGTSLLSVLSRRLNSEEEMEMINFDGMLKERCVHLVVIIWKANTITVAIL